jgi:hypothetical protein
VKVAAAGNSPLEKGDEGGLLLGGEDLVNEGDEGLHRFSCQEIREIPRFFLIIFTSGLLTG